MNEGGRRVVVLPDADAVAREAASDFTRRARTAAQERVRFTVALAGGSTPRRLYALLADEAAPFRAQIPWDRVHLFWGDERPVPPDDPESNYRMVRETLLSRVALPAGNVHRIEAERADPSEAAELYEEELRRFFALPPGQVPRLDLALLGMGRDGHTASLFPGSSALAVRDRLVAAPWVAQLNSYRITLTLPVFNGAAAVSFLVAGRDKAETLSAVLDGGDRNRFPCQLIQPVQGELSWLVDEAAATALRRP